MITNSSDDHWITWGNKAILSIQYVRHLVPILRIYIYILYILYIYVCVYKYIYIWDQKFLLRFPFLTIFWERTIPFNKCLVYVDSSASFTSERHSGSLRLPSGELTVCNGKSQFFMGKSTISMAIFNSYVNVYQRVKRT